MLGQHSFTQLLSEQLRLFLYLFVWVSPTTIAEILAIAVMVTLASVGHFLLIKAFQLNGASDLAPLNYSDLFLRCFGGFFI